MELTRLRTAATLACGGGMISLALAGCNAGDGTTASSGSSPVANHSSGPAAARDHVAAGHDTPDGDTPACMAGMFRAVLHTRTSNSETKGLGMLTLTNRAHESCRIPAGWAPIGTGGPHEYKALPATLSSHPRSGRALTLRPGHSAYAGLRWHTATGCGATSGLGVAWHSSWIPLTYRGLNGHKAPICDHLVLGTLQPTDDDVNFT